jgi:hypothetical protein
VCRDVEHYHDGAVYRAGQCRADDIGPTCSWDWQCDEGTVCRPSSDRVGEPETRCQARGPQHALCGEGGDCQDGLLCLYVGLREPGGLFEAGECLVWPPGE